MRNPGLEPGSPKRTLEPESSASTNSASSAYLGFAAFSSAIYHYLGCYGICQPH